MTIADSCSIENSMAVLLKFCGVKNVPALAKPDFFEQRFNLGLFNYTDHPCNIPSAAV